MLSTFKQKCKYFLKQLNLDMHKFKYFFKIVYLSIYLSIYLS